MRRPLPTTRDFCGLGGCCRLRSRGIRFRTGGILPRRKIRIEKSEGVRGFNDPNAFPLLFLDNLFVKLPHSRPMQLWTEMVLSMVTVIKPKQVVPFVIGTHSPGDRLIEVTAIMKEIAVQVGATMSQVIKRKEEDPEFPVYHQPNCDCHS